MLSERDATPVTRRGLQHLRGLVASDEIPAELSAAWADQQIAVPIGRRVTVVGAHGGAGTTTVAVCLAQELHARRSDGVALIDDAHNRSDLAIRLPVRPAGSVRESAHLHHERTRTLLCFTPSGSSADADQLGTSLRRTAGVTVTDGGGRMPATGPHADAIVLCGEASVRGLDASWAALHELADVGWSASNVLLVLTNLVPDSGVDASEAAKLAAAARVTSFTIAHDRHLAGAAGIDQAKLSLSASRDVALVAGWSVRASAGRR